MRTPAVGDISNQIISRRFDPNSFVCLYRRTSNYWIVSGKKTSVYRGSRGSRRSACGPNENLKERLSICRYYPASLVNFSYVICQLWNKKSNVGDSILAKFNNYRSYGNTNQSGLYQVNDTSAKCFSVHTRSASMESTCCTRACSSVLLVIWPSATSLTRSRVSCSLCRLGPGSCSAMSCKEWATTDLSSLNTWPTNPQNGVLIKVSSRSGKRQVFKL